MHFFLENIFIVQGEKLKVYFCASLFLAQISVAGSRWKPLCMKHPLLHRSLEHSMGQIIIPNRLVDVGGEETS